MMPKWMLAAKERRERATPGEWRIHIGFDRFSTNPGCYGAYLEIGNECNALVSGFSDGTKELISHAPTDLARYEAALELALGVLDEARNPVYGLLALHASEALAAINALGETK